jgi:hypothetical protein
MYAVETSTFKIFKILKLSCYKKWLKSSCCYNSHEASLCGGFMHSLYVQSVC